MSPLRTTPARTLPPAAPRTADWPVNLPYRLSRLALLGAALSAGLLLSACGGGDTAPMLAAADDVKLSTPPGDTALAEADPAPALAAKAGSSAPQPTLVSFTNSDGLTIPGYFYKPSGNGPFPAVVLAHGCSGLFSYSVPANGLSNIHKEWAKRLVDAGYAALLVDSFSPRTPANAPNQSQCGNGFAGTDEVLDRPKDIVAGAAWLMQQPSVAAGRLGLLGWSNGGTATLSTMSGTQVQRPFRTAVSFYPGCGMMNHYGGLAQSSWLPYAPVTILHGSLDPLYTVGACDQRIARATLLGAGAGQGNGVQMMVYQGAIHSFDMATAVGGSFTASDVAAKQAADIAAMAQFDAALKN
jgi:carboxymethylenebutenolidase